MHPPLLPRGGAAKPGCSAAHCRRAPSHPSVPPNRPEPRHRHAAGSDERARTWHLPTHQESVHSHGVPRGHRHFVAATPDSIQRPGRSSVPHPQDSAVPGTPAASRLPSGDFEARRHWRRPGCGQRSPHVAAGPEGLRPHCRHVHGCADGACELVAHHQREAPVGARQHVDERVVRILSTVHPAGNLHVAGRRSALRCGEHPTEKTAAARLSIV